MKTFRACIISMMFILPMLVLTMIGAEVCNEHITMSIIYVVWSVLIIIIVMANKDKH